MNNKKSVHRTIRLKPANDLIVKTIADTLFRDSYDPEHPHEGNYSAGLNFIIEQFRKQDELGKLLQLLFMKTQYDNGVRSKEVIESVKHLEAYLALLQSNTNI